MAKRKIFKLIPLLLFSILAFTYTFILANPFDLTTSDLGRHLVNGREVLAQNWQVLFKNTYSYTMPEQNFINHHWLVGVIFWLTYNMGGFLTLHLLHTAILVAFLLLFFYLLKTRSSWTNAFLLSLLAIVFLATRIEIRPESFGFLLLTIYLLIISKIQHTKKITLKQILLVLALQVVWTNLHISFVFGLFVFGLFALAELAINKSLTKKTSQKLIILVTLLGLTSLINPNTIQGALNPFTIFQDYGYKVYENQNLCFGRYCAFAFLRFCLRQNKRSFRGTQ